MNFYCGNSAIEWIYFLCRPVTWRLYAEDAHADVDDNSRDPEWDPVWRATAGDEADGGWDWVLHHRRSVVGFRIGHKIVFEFLGSSAWQFWSAARAWGQKILSVAMFTWAKIGSHHIGDAFISIQLSFDIYSISNHHLVVDYTIYTSFNKPSPSGWRMGCL